MKTIFTFLILSSVSCLIFSQKEYNIESGGNIIHLKTYGTGKPILIINGGPGMHSEGFKALAEVLGQSNMAIIYDQRGTGKSKIATLDTNTITMDLMVADIEAIRNYLNLESWIVMGHSFGGMLASYYASKHPNKVTGLILSSSGGINMKLFETVDITSRLSTMQMDSLNYWRNKISTGDTTYYAKLQRGKFLAPAYLFDKSNVPIVAHRLTQANFEVNRLVFQNMRLIKFDCSKGLKGFEPPVLIIQGKQDLVDRSIAEIAHSVFQNSTITILDRCGHYGWLDRPVQYFSVINEFLAKVEAKEIISNKQ